MTREDIIREIVDRDIHSQALSAEVVQRDAPQLYSAACEQFGTWDTALKYAGVSVRRAIVDDEYSRERVLQKIRRLCWDGYDLSAHHNARRDWRLYNAARLQFGGWRLALLAAGINLENIRPTSKSGQHDRRKIIKELRSRHEAGLPLTWGPMCLDNRALAIAAKSAFRSWRRALAAAGLAPEERVSAGGPRWDRDRVIDAIKARHRKGNRMTATATRKEDNALAAAVRRYFSSWNEALQAAGIEPGKPGRKKSGK